MNQTDNRNPNEENSIVSIDEGRLESDIAYRFRYAADVIGLGEPEHEILRQHRDTIEPHLGNIVESVYQKMFQFDAMKRHFLPRNSGFESGLPASLEELNIGHQQIQFRKQRLHEYFVKLCTADWDDTFAVLVDVVGDMHTLKEGNSALEVPLVQITALLGVINDLFLETISKLELSAKTQLAIQRTYTKLFWVQNCMFVRHWTN